jgi:hypothetical protein
MNIFWLDPDPVICAKYHNDKHCVKMILEYAQLLSAAHHVHSSPYKEHVYRMTHKGHPCTKYVCSSVFAYEEVYQLLCALLNEYTYRYGKTHKTALLLNYLMKNPVTNDDSIVTKPQCMPDEYKQPYIINAYRDYYMLAKRHLASWTKRSSPYWWRD